MQILLIRAKRRANASSLKELSPTVCHLFYDVVYEIPKTIASMSDAGHYCYHLAALPSRRTRLACSIRR